MIAGTHAEYQSDAWSTKDTPCLAQTGELWSVCCEDFGKIDRVKTAAHCIAMETLIMPF